MRILRISETNAIKKRSFRLAAKVRAGLASQAGSLRSPDDDGTTDNGTEDFLTTNERE